MVRFQGLLYLVFGPPMCTNHLGELISPKHEWGGQGVPGEVLGTTLSCREPHIAAASTSVHGSAGRSHLLRR
jgi:hypothetical protein